MLMHISHFIFAYFIDQKTKIRPKFHMYLPIKCLPTFYVKLPMNEHTSRIHVFFVSFLAIDFSLTVKLSTLIFISEPGSAISSAKEWKSGFI